MARQITTQCSSSAAAPAATSRRSAPASWASPRCWSKASRLGGTCLNLGCIPSKAMIHVAGEFEAMRMRPEATASSASSSVRAAVDRHGADRRMEGGIVGKLTGGVGALLKRRRCRSCRAGRRSRRQDLTCDDASGEPVTITAEHVLLAAGSDAGRAADPASSAAIVISSTEALALHATAEELVVVGAGYIGLELGIAFRKLGCGGDRRRGAGPHPAALRRGARPSRSANGSRSTASPCIWAPRRRAERAGRAMAWCVENKAGKTLDIGRRQGARRRRPPAAHRGLGPGSAGAGHERPLREGRRPVPHLDAERLGDRRPHGRADAGAQGDGAGRDGGRDHRRASTRTSRRPRFPAVCFTDPEIVTSPACCRPKRRPPDRRIIGAVSVLRQRPRAVDGGAARRLRARRRAQGQPRILGLQAVGAHVSELSGEFVQRSRWARGSKTSRARSTRIRRWAKRCTKRRCGRWATRSISDTPLMGA